MRQGSDARCAYGCAKMANKAILELLIATKLSEIDRNNINPVEYVCEGWSYECAKIFCHSDGCNQLATLPKLGGWARLRPTPLALCAYDNHIDPSRSCNLCSRCEAVLG